jgi:hypothetical protein
MMVPMRGTGIAAGALALALTLGACSSGALTDAEWSRATSLPTPTAQGPTPQHVLDGLVHSLVESRSVSVDEDYVVDGRETEVRLGWKARGAVVDASILPITSSTPGTEVYRSPSAFLSRPTGDGAACWTQADPSMARFQSPEPAALAALLTSRAVKKHGSVIAGAVWARPVLEILGTDEQLKARGLLAPRGVEVPATFGTSDGGLRITVAWSDLVAAAGNSSRHTRVGTWTLWFRPGTGGPAAPPADQVVALARTDPSFASALRACNARVQ